MKKRELYTTIKFLSLGLIACLCLNFYLIQLNIQKPDVTRLKKTVETLKREREVQNNLRLDIITEQKARIRRFQNREQNRNLERIVAYQSMIQSTIDHLMEYVESKNIDPDGYIYDASRFIQAIATGIEKSVEGKQQEKAKHIEEYVFKKLEILQNPQLGSNGCPKYNKLLECSNIENCGTGCVLHHQTFCLMASLALNRTIRITRRSLKEDFPFDQPGSKLELCDFKGMKSSFWEERFSSYPIERLNEEVDILDLQMIDYFTDDKAPFLPHKIPAELHRPLTDLHRRPFIMFVGMLLRFQIRNVNLNWAEFFSKIGLLPEMHFVGVHVRRTDKSIEANFYKLSEYMKHVKAYYDAVDYHNIMQGRPKAMRVVYLATDEPNVWLKEVPEFVLKGYRFYGDFLSAQSANIKDRKKVSSKRKLLRDVIMLSESNHLVCTLTSQICRIAFELMQTSNKSRGLDMSHRITSLDDPYYYGGQHEHGLKVIVPHQPKNNKSNEFKLYAGDIVGIAKDKHNGYYQGDHQVEAGITHLGELPWSNYPAFKVEENVPTSKYWAFDDFKDLDE